MSTVLIQRSELKKGYCQMQKISKVPDEILNFDGPEFPINLTDNPKVNNDLIDGAYAPLFQRNKRSRNNYAIFALIGLGIAVGGTCLRKLGTTPKLLAQ